MIHGTDPFPRAPRIFSMAGQGGIQTPQAWSRPPSPKGSVSEHSFGTGTGGLQLSDAVAADLERAAIKAEHDQGLVQELYSLEQEADTKAYYLTLRETAQRAASVANTLQRIGGATARAVANRGFRLLTAAWRHSAGARPHSGPSKASARPCGISITWACPVSPAAPGPSSRRARR